MVSYPSDDTRSLSHLPSARRASSVASSSASTVRRHHHRGRSHAGGSSSRAPSNEFPFFAHTGDVEIVIVPDPKTRRRRDSGRGGSDDGVVKRYLLHRLILAQCSGFFEASTSQEWSRGQARGQAGAAAGTQLAPYNTRGPEGPSRQRWRYELDWGRSDDETPMLVQKDPSSSHFGAEADSRHTRPPPTRPKPQPPPSGFFRSMANFSALSLSTQSRHASRDESSADARLDPLHPSELLIQAYDNLFRIFYNYPPLLDTADIARAYVECKALLQLADMYDALEVVGQRVDHHLLRFGSKLWKQIAKYPPSYLRIGYLAKSKAIFAEAIVHVVGSWPSCAAQLGYAGPYAPRATGTAAPQTTQLPEAVFEIIEDKVDDLEDLKAKVEAKLWRLTLTTSRGERVAPANAWLDWLAMSLFRQWLAENTTPPPVSILKDTSNPDAGRGSSRGSTAVTTSSSYRSSSSTRRGQSQAPPPPASFNPAGSVVSASAAAYPPAARSSHSKPSSHRSPPPFNTGRVFRLLGQGGEAYLAHHELKAFLKLHPDNYDREKLRKFERRMQEIKNLARDAVKPLMRNFLSVDVVGAANADRDGVAVGYLTCTRVGEGDFPWDD